MTVRIQVLHTPDCPHIELTVERVRGAVARLAPEAEMEVGTVATLEAARKLEFPGSPTVRVNGRDLEGGPVGSPRLECRDYGGSGVPAVWLVEAALLRAQEPGHVLFLCVANSARSQMAEGIARSLAPEGVRISSAGSAPSSVRPEAVEVLREMGVDIRDQQSKGTEAITGDVAAVITLCAEEVCPTWLGEAPQAHWALPDPAAVEGDGGERLEAFRAVRDELRKRLEVLFR